MNKNQAIQYASEQQMEADNIGYLLIKAKMMMEFQSICDFNVFWLHDVSPVVFHIETVEFLLKYKDQFKRKMTAREFVKYDAIVIHQHPKDFNDFKSKVI